MIYSILNILNNFRINFLSTLGNLSHTRVFNSFISITLIWRFTPFVYVYAAHPHWAQIGFQEPASPVMEGIIDFHHDLMFFLVFILGFVCWFLMNIGYMFFNRFPATMILRRQRHSKHINFIRKPSLISHNLWLEIIWTIIPALILISIVLPSFALIYSMDEFFLHPRLTLKAIGNQWYWTYNYGCSLEYGQNPTESNKNENLETNNVIIEDLNKVFNPRSVFIVSKNFTEDDLAQLFAISLIPNEEAVSPTQTALYPVFAKLAINANEIPNIPVTELENPSESIEVLFNLLLLHDTEKSTNHFDNYTRLSPNDLIILTRSFFSPASLLQMSGYKNFTFDEIFDNLLHKSDDEINLLFENFMTFCHYREEGRTYDEAISWITLTNNREIRPEPRSTESSSCPAVDNLVEILAKVEGDTLTKDETASVMTALSQIMAEDLSEPAPSNAQEAKQKLLDILHKQLESYIKFHNTVMKLDTSPEYCKKEARKLTTFITDGFSCAKKPTPSSPKKPDSSTFIKPTPSSPKKPNCPTFVETISSSPKKPEDQTCFFNRLLGHIKKNPQRGDLASFSNISHKILSSNASSKSVPMQLKLIDDLAICFLSPTKIPSEGKCGLFVDVQDNLIYTSLLLEFQEKFYTGQSTAQLTQKRDNVHDVLINIEKMVTEKRIPEEVADDYRKSKLYHYLTDQMAQLSLAIRVRALPFADCPPGILKLLRNFYLAAYTNLITYSNCPDKMLGAYPLNNAKERALAPIAEIFEGFMRCKPSLKCSDKELMPIEALVNAFVKAENITPVGTCELIADLQQNIKMISMMLEYAEKFYGQSTAQLTQKRDNAIDVITNIEKMVTEKRIPEEVANDYRKSELYHYLANQRNELVLAVGLRAFPFGDCSPGILKLLRNFYLAEYTNLITYSNCPVEGSQLARLNKVALDILCIRCNRYFFEMLKLAPAKSFIMPSVDESIPPELEKFRQDPKLDQVIQTLNYINKYMDNQDLVKKDVPPSKPICRVNVGQYDLLKDYSALLNTYCLMKSLLPEETAIDKMIAVQAICSSDIPHKCSMITTFYEEMQYTNSVLDALVSTIFFDLVESLSYFDQFRSYKIHGFSISKILDCFVLPALQNFNKTDLSDLPLALNGKALHNIFLIDNNLQLANDDNASQIQLFLDHCKGWKILSDVETTIGQLEKFTNVLPDIKSTKLLLMTYSLAYKEFVSLYLKPVHEKNLEIKNAVPVLTPTSSLNFARHHFAVKFDSYMKPTEYINEYQIRLLEVDKRVILPTQTGIRLLISSYDVLHSWAIPSMGIKLDGCPGRLNQTFLYIKEPGLFYGQCSEICGTQHAFMPISVRAIPAHEFNFWLAQQIEPIGQLAKHLETAKSANKK